MPQQVNGTGTVIETRDQIVQEIARLVERLSKLNNLQYPWNRFVVTLDGRHMVTIPAELFRSEQVKAQKGDAVTFIPLDHRTVIMRISPTYISQKEQNEN